MSVAKRVADEMDGKHCHVLRAMQQTHALLKSNLADMLGTPFGLKT